VHKWLTFLFFVFATATIAMPVRADGWATFKERFVTSDGRVVDNANDGISHSEGQGYGLLLAEAAGDRPAFARIWSWTRTHLAIRDDGLLAWRYEPGAGITDINAASDGDLLVAWALLRAAERWGVAGYRATARRLLSDLAEAVVVTYGGRTVMLPAPDGFVRERSVVLNPSYWVFPALRRAAEADPDGPWAELHAQGLDLIADARMAPSGKVPDWIALHRDGTLRASAEFGAVWGYNAVRVPLYLIWDGRSGHPAAAGAMLPPTDGVVATRVEAVTGHVLERNPEPGYRAIGRLGRCRTLEQPLAALYYPAALQLLARIAAHEGARSC
jgi:endoglucanase